MNNVIEIEDISTYPNSLLKFFEKEKECLYNTFENKNVVLDSSTHLYKQIDDILSKKYFYAIHATRLINPKDIIEKGIIIPSTSVFLMEHFIENLKDVLNNDEIEFVRNLLYTESREKDVNKKYNKVWFVFGKLKDISLKNGFYMLKKYGGEFLEDIFTNINKKDFYFEKIAFKGEPYAVEFKIEFCKVNNLRKNQIINRMLEKYLFDTKPEHNFIEAFTTNNISKEQIMSITPIEIKEN